MPTQITLKDDEGLGPTLHILRPRVVEVRIDEAVNAMWVSIDGICRFRVDNLDNGQVHLVVNNLRKRKK